MPAGETGAGTPGNAAVREMSAALLHPVWWGALAALVVNDHVLKGAGLLPGAITGKLSDVAGLIVAPVLLAVLLRVKSRRGVALCVAAVGSWFAVVNTVPNAARAMEWLTAQVGLGWTLWCDPSDLLALPALGVAAWLMLEAKPRSRRIVVERTLAVAAAVGCVATSAAAPSPPVSTPGKVLSQAPGKGATFVIDSATGRRLSAPAFNRIGAHTIEVGGVVYGVLGSRVVGISIASEQEVMSVDYDNGSFSGPPLTDGQRLFMVTRGGGTNDNLVAVDLRSAKIAWEQKLSGRQGARAGQRPIMAGGMIIVLSGSKLSAHDPGSGKVRWIHEGAKPYAWPTADARSVFAADEDGTITRFDLRKGTVMWRYAVGNGDGFRGDYFDGARLGAGNDVLAFLRGDKLMGIEADTRAVRWTGPAVDDVVIGRDIAIARMDIDGDDYQVAFRMSDGKKLWKLNADDWMRVDPTLDEHNGIVLIRPFHGELRAYTMGEGKLMWRFLLDEGQRADTLHGRVQLVPGRGAL